MVPARGELDEALRILRDEVLPTFEQLGDSLNLSIFLMSYARLLLTQPTVTRTEVARAALQQSLAIADNYRFSFGIGIRILLKWMENGANS
jgi:hypothetical protein